MTPFVHQSEYSTSVNSHVEVHNFIILRKSNRYVRGRTQQGSLWWAFLCPRNNKRVDSITVVFLTEILHQVVREEKAYHHHHSSIILIAIIPHHSLSFIIHHHHHENAYYETQLL
jgi:hypothetical protein